MSLRPIQSTDTVLESTDTVKNETLMGRQVIEETANSMRAVAGAVNDSSVKIRNLADSSEEISKLVVNIEKIASQTNLLALNATIEAARAGEAGKGFAVVAGEVKNLANQTAKATETITDTINSLMEDIEAVVSSMRQGAQAVEKGEASMQLAVQSMDNIAGSVDMTTESIREISGVLNEQNSATNEISENIAVSVRTAASNVLSIGDNIQMTEKVVGLISNQILRLSEFDIPNKSIRIAKSDHVIWKKKLADMLVGLNALDPDELASHMHCRLGKWYYGDIDPAITNHPAYKELEPPHKIVHECGIEAARRYKAGDIDKAYELVTQVGEASKEVLRLLDVLIEEV
ncbi:methyl-accepting chemotaxis protein [Terasakiella pusilla]|uniref:methyl-accepting chemotaxis protein n=1 Tax=Terasakiella pusilla TaxID=64973 RepID=UPI003AA811E9